MNRHERRRLKRKLAALDAKASATLEAFVREHRPGRNLFLTELLSPDQALAHPLFGVGTKEALTAAYGSAHGVGPGLIAECFGCCGQLGPKLAARGRADDHHRGRQGRRGPALRDLRKPRRTGSRAPGDARAGARLRLGEHAEGAGVGPVDGGWAGMSAPLEPDRAQIEQFFRITLRHADEGTFVSLRSFEHGAGTKPFAIKAVKVNGDLGGLIDTAVGMARAAAKARQGVVFAPPIATFANPSTPPRPTSLMARCCRSNAMCSHARRSRSSKGLLGRATLTVASAANGPIPIPGRSRTSCTCIGC